MRVRILVSSPSDNRPLIRPFGPPSPLRGEGIWCVYPRRTQNLVPFPSSVWPSARHLSPGEGNFAPGALARQTQARLLNRSRDKFLQTQGPVARNEWHASTPGFARRKYCSTKQERVPRNGGSRGNLTWRTRRKPKFDFVNSPSVFWFLFHVEKEPAHRAEPYSTRRNSGEILPKKSPPPWTFS